MRLRFLTFSCTLLGLLLPAVALAAPPGPAGFRPVIAVEATYPGASAAVVADTVAAPIEQQVNGAEHLTHLVSRCTNDGRYTLLLGFDARSNFDLIQVLVQNRVSLALPTLPEAVKLGDVTVRKITPGALLVVALTSPDDSKDPIYLGNFAVLQIKDELARVAGVAEVSQVGGEDYGLRVLLDREKLAAVKMTPNDVMKALREQNLREKTKPAGRPPVKSGEPLELRLETGSRIADPETLAAVVLKTAPGGGVVRLRDVARVEVGAGAAHGEPSFDGRPAAALAVSVLPGARPRDVSAAVRERMEQLRKSFPPGIDYTVALHLTPAGAGRPAPPWYLLAEPTLPPAASPQRARDCLKRYAELLKETKGVRHVLSLPEAPFALFRGGPCAVAIFDPGMKEADWDRTRQAVADRLNREVRSASPRLRDLSGPAGVRADGYPVEFALSGADDRAARDFAEALAARLSRTGKLTDVAAGPKTVPQVYVDIDKDKAAEMGVKLADVFDVLQTTFGAAEGGETNPSDRTRRVRVQLDPPSRDAVSDVKKLQVRNTKGDIVSLASLVTIRETTGPESVDRVDLRPAARISANPAPGVSLAQARWLCETLAEQVRKEQRLPAEYGLVWLAEVPAAKPIPGDLKSGPEPAAPEVTVAQPVSREVTDSEDFTGRLDAVESVDLRPRVTGYLDKVLFKEGADVKKGDALFVIDQRPYKAALDQAQANQKAAQEQSDLARRTLERIRASGAAATRADVEVAEGQSRVAAAQADAAKAAVEIARLNLDWTTVRSPIDGRIGRSLLDAGNLVRADETPLGNVVSLDPVYVYFGVDERTLLRLERLARAGKGKGLARADVPVSVGLADEDGYPRRGTLSFVDNRVSADTGMVQMRVTLPNTDRSLRPGLFARVRLAVGAPHKALLVPEDAVGDDQGRKTVYVVDKDNKVVSRAVTLGAKQNGLRVVSEGLKPDERVIVEGRSRARPGQTVKPVAGKGDGP
ncbi:MAG TPA: efflux RND transporter permease subunit [Gemmataceae bacterium]|nr:efflux RND transporter permease subunit [Gemmataceae bacterium]